MKENLEEPIFNFEENVKFLKRAKNGEYAEIELSSFNYLRAHVDVHYINTEEPEYYHGYI
jgi:hypothetical protein